MVLKICNHDGVFRFIEARRRIGSMPEKETKLDNKMVQVMRFYVDDVWEDIYLDDVAAIFLLNGRGDTIEKLYQCPRTEVEVVE